MLLCFRNVSSELYIVIYKKKFYTPTKSQAEKRPSEITLSKSVCKHKRDKDN